MWSRAQLKQNAKNAFKGSYWICVAAALILMLFVYGSDNSGVKINFNQDRLYYQNPEDFGIPGALFRNGLSAWNAMEIQVFGFTLRSLTSTIMPLLASIAAFGVVFRIFIGSPLEVGGNYFFVNNSLSGTPSLGDLLHAFKGNQYLSVVGIQLWKSVKTFLWTLCLVIPGIIKSYEYYMVPYLLADHPGISSREVFQTSRDMMMGHKFDTFVLELSFIGWEILNGITFGLLGIFYVKPYRFATRAELYLALKAEHNAQNDMPSGGTFRGVQF